MSTAAARHTQASLRAGREGKVLVSPSGRLGVDPVTGREITGFTENGWVGLSLLHALFALEHNAICDMLKKHNPLWDDERLFQQARLVNSALLAKIHTVEWSTAILPAEVTATGLRTNWYGRFSKLQNVFPKLADNDIFSRHSRVADRAPRRAVHADRGVRLGLPHAPADAGSLHDSVGRRPATGWPTPSCRSCRAGAASSSWRASSRRICSTRSGSTIPARCGCTTIRSTLQNLVQDNGDRFDLGTIDILRDRERGVPRYNRFRRLLHKPPVRSFEELTDVPEWADEIKRVYNNDLEKVDTMVGPDGRAAAEGIRLQRHGVPHLPADGVAPAEERPLPVARLPPGDLHQGGDRLGRGERR